MNLLLKFLILSLPSFLYLVILRSYGKKWSQVFRNIGLQISTPYYYLLSLGPLIFLLGITWLALQLIPQDALRQFIQDPNYSAISPKNVVSFILLILQVGVSSLGEEIFFRGFLGGLLIRRLGFALGNVLQALIFLIPHLFLLSISLSLWPFLVVQAVSGWIFGLLYYRSGSIFPSWLIHIGVNLFVILMLEKL